jgi:hypothetical protein
MAVDATIWGLGFSGFLFLYAAFSISQTRFFEKSILYFLGLIQALTIMFVLLSESLEVGSTIAYLATFLENYFVFMTISFIAIIAVFMLHLLEKRLNILTGGKDDGKE